LAWSFGKIFKSKWDSTTVVVKTIWPNLLTHKGTCEAFLKEIEVTSSICHPNIITCMGANGNSMPIFIVLKYMPLGSLYDLFQNELIPELPFVLRASLELQVTHSMQHFHSRNMVLGSQVTQHPARQQVDRQDQQPGHGQPEEGH